MHVLLGERSSEYARFLTSKGKTCIVYHPMGAPMEPFSLKTIVVRDYDDLVVKVVENASSSSTFNVAYKEDSKFHTCDEFKRVADALGVTFRLKKRSDYTCHYWRPVWESQALQNIPEIAKAYSADSLNFNNIPAIVLGAGPSFGKNIKTLKKLKGKALIIATQRTFKPLVDVGIIPNVVVTLDAGDVPVKNFEDTPTEKVDALLLEMSVHPDIWRLPAKIKFAFACHGGNFPEICKLFKKVNLFSSGATVAVSGVIAAMIWQCNPIITLGVDLASCKNRYDGGPLEKAEFSLPSWDFKGTVSAESDLCSTHSWLTTIARIHPEFKFINCSFGGAGIPGFIHKKLNFINKTLKKRYNFEEMFNELPPTDDSFTRRCLLSDLDEKLDEKLINISQKWKD